MPERRAFTATASAIAAVLQSDCWVGVPGKKPQQRFIAIWDTGATHSAITQKVVDQCELKPTGRVLMNHAGNEERAEETDQYVVNLALPNKVIVEAVEVSRGGFVGGDVLIGMDIITLGDFAITNTKERTKFTFQVPSQTEIDFVNGTVPPRPNRESRRAQQRRTTRRRIRPKRN